MSTRHQIAQLFSRNISSGKLIPEVDGLRFLAILLVYVHHVHSFFEFSSPFQFHDVDQFSLLRKWLIDGRKGVDLFFVISGFILALPFAKSYLKGAPAPSLKKYFRRRLTRLEPPYIVAMVGMFVVFPLVTLMDYTLAFQSLLASLIYSHVFIFGVTSFLLSVAWSLELEVHFYVLAPLLFLVLKAPVVIRRVSLLLIILGLPFVQICYQTPGFYLLHYIQYFLAGILLADLYIERPNLPTDRWPFAVLGALFFGAVLFLPHVRTHLMSNSEMPNAMIFPLTIAAFYYIVLTNPFWGKIFAYRWISLIGGMCYSIYLVHQPILSAVMKIVFKYQFFESYGLEVLTVTLICIPPVMLGSIIFFLLVEKPCMDPEWPEKVAKRLKTAFRK
jgi:peptidoglycan/LPS O-acetylase OafA/YrhL